MESPLSSLEGKEVGTSMASKYLKPTDMVDLGHKEVDPLFRVKKRL